ncbi:group III truncated hemoglobin [Mycobacterium colombiense]|uniref:group III truncated hemoglobin n=1 Tax=Mycobacterium colombiense TaxID=339268 RepID=UPI002678E9D0
MSQLTTTGADLVDRADVEALLRRFYGRALDDEVLAEPFAELRATGLEAHVPTMCDFWETVLFRAGLYRRSALQAHRDIHARAPLSDRHFRRWLMLWHNTVDEMYHGPAADRAKVQAGRIAWAMHRRLTGVEAPELLVRQPARDGQAPGRTGTPDR